MEGVFSGFDDGGW